MEYKDLINRLEKAKKASFGEALGWGGGRDPRFMKL